MVWRPTFMFSFATDVGMEWVDLPKLKMGWKRLKMPWFSSPVLVFVLFYKQGRNLSETFLLKKFLLHLELVFRYFIPKSLAYFLFKSKYFAVLISGNSYLKWYMIYIDIQNNEILYLTKNLNITAFLPLKIYILPLLFLVLRCRTIR